MSTGAQIVLGPIASVHVRSFVGFVRDLVRDYSGDPVLSLTFTPTITKSIQAMFDSWADAATTDTFNWSATLPTDHAEYLLYALFLGVQNRRQELGGAPNGPEFETRREFTRHLIGRFTSALMATSDADHSRIEHISQSWPLDLGS